MNIKKIIANKLIKLWDSAVGFFIEGNNARLIVELKNKKKINIVFLISENEKWSSFESLYREFELTDRFIPIVAITKLKRHSQADLEKNEAFFSEKKLNS